jgi:hypothetical protein
MGLHWCPWGPTSPGIGHLRKGVQTEQVAEEIRTRPDGTVCKCPGLGRSCGSENGDTRKMTIHMENDKMTKYGY